ncbi:hypothetical protein BGZ76_003283 [Entomortierella beljakovae]|nr:hypothetical protein BGZ76_003283 [Entomortierella beljakovae]
MRRQLSDKPGFWSTRRTIISLLTLVVIIVGLTLGFIFGPRSRNHIFNDSPEIPGVWNNPSEYILSKNFSITNTTKTRYYEWTISQKSIAPDGLERPMLLVNGIFPGPLVEANTGDRIVVKVTNDMVNGTAIHWHGMFQNGTNWMDGTTGVTQCPIPPGQSFTYNFTVPNQWGTYWWHAHAASQYIDGIIGPLIIHSPDEPHRGKYDEDLIMMISDHYHTDSGSLVSWFISTESEGVEPVPDNGLINGRNSFDCKSDSDALFPSGLKCTPNAPLSEFEFKSGLTYRIRIINTGSFADFHFSIDNHTLTVIEADGVDMNPVDVQRIPIHVAQRYSVLVHANQTVGNYWIRALMNTNCFNVDNPALNPNVMAVVHYDGASKSQVANSKDWESNTWFPHCIDLTSDMLKPVLELDAPEADIQIRLDISFQTITQSHINMGYMNETSWVPLKNDATLFQANKGVSLFDASQFIVTLDTTQTVELIVNNFDEGAHPFHLHGHVFYVLGTGDGSYMPGRSILNSINPLRRDTVTIPQFGYAVLRFVNDNPGLWTFHCHIDWHMQAGLLMQFLSLPSQVRAFDIPPELEAMCGPKTS